MALDILIKYHKHSDMSLNAVISNFTDQLSRLWSTFLLTRDFLPL